jgi:hypothetical protein
MASLSIIKCVETLAAGREVIAMAAKGSAATVVLQHEGARRC